jgi:hypothetical protein
MGLRGKVSRTTLADANESHDWRIFADFAQILIGIARSLYAGDPIGVDLDASLDALDSTTIDLCLSLFPWARFRKHKAAVKMHTLLDLHGSIPTFISITEFRAARSTRQKKTLIIDAGAPWLTRARGLFFKYLSQLAIPTFRYFGLGGDTNVSVVLIPIHVTAEGANVVRLFDNDLAI